VFVLKTAKNWICLVRVLSNYAKTMNMIMKEVREKNNLQSEGQPNRQTATSHTPFQEQQ
jgi:hypothetical protein